MAVFDLRNELGRQSKHVGPDFDKSLGLKLLGFKETGERNLWGRALSNVMLGSDTLTHLIAKKTASGDTAKALDETFDETINKDFSKAAFAVDAAKMIAGGGGGFTSGLGAGDAAAGGIGGNLMNMFGSGDGGMMNLFKGGDGVGQAGKLGSTLNEAGTNIVGDMNSDFTNMKNAVESDVLKNPFEVDSPEYNSFQKMLDAKNKSDSMSATKSGFGNLIQSAAGGNIVESGLNFGTAALDSYRTQKDVANKYSMGRKVTDSSINYL